MDGGGGGEITKIALDGVILLGKPRERENDRNTGDYFIVFFMQ